MSIWDSFLRLFGQQPKPSAPSSSAKSGHTSNIVLASEPTVVQPDPLTVLFDKKDKHKTTMLNSITLSTDMKTLYLIDNGRAIPYDLTVPQGIMVGLIGDQLVVATGREEPEDEGGEPAGDVGTDRPETDRIIVKAEASSQFTLAYNETNKILSVIGFEDVILHLTNPDDDNTSEAVFEIGRNKVIRIRRMEDTLIVEKV